MKLYKVDTPFGHPKMVILTCLRTGGKLYFMFDECVSEQEFINATWGMSIDWNSDAATSIEDMRIMLPGLEQLKI